MENYVKPLTWQRMVSGEYVELFHFDEERNLVCLNGRKAVVYEQGGILITEDGKRVSTALKVVGDASSSHIV